MPSFLSGSTSAVTVSLAMHAAAFLVAAVHHVQPAPVAPPIEISIESELPRPPDPPKEEEPVANRAAETLTDLRPVSLRSPVHHEAPAVHAVAATDAKPDHPSPPADAPPALVGDDALPHFTIATSHGGAGGQNLAKSAGTAPLGGSESNDDGPYAEGAVDVPARAMHEVRPRYPLEARESGIDGSVRLVIVLSAAGVVEDVRAVTHLGHGLEQEAIVAVKKTPFTPAMKRGRAVPVRMAWTVEFQLQ